MNDTSIKYFPFGDRRNSQGTLGTDKQFTGQRLDGTGLYYYNARYYDPTIGRFISADTQIQSLAKPQFMNRYSYTINNPLNYIDPSGHSVTDDAGGMNTAYSQSMFLWALSIFGWGYTGGGVGGGPLGFGVNATIYSVPGMGINWPAPIFIAATGSDISNSMSMWGITLPFGIFLDAAVYDYNPSWIGLFYRTVMHELYHYREAGLPFSQSLWWDEYCVEYGLNYLTNGFDGDAAYGASSFEVRAYAYENNIDVSLTWNNGCMIVDNNLGIVYVIGSNGTVNSYTNSNGIGDAIAMANGEWG